MALQFTKVKADAFQKLQMNAGILTLDFDPTAPEDFDPTKIITATVGGINATAIPTYADSFDGVDNAQLNMLEGKIIESWECKMSATCVNADLSLIQMMLGCADIDETKGSVKPRSSVELTDFRQIWWVGDRADGGMFAIHLKNALSTGGFTLQTNDKGKGEFTLELTGHVSLDAQDDIPMEFYVGEPTPVVPAP